MLEMNTRHGVHELQGFALQEWDAVRNWRASFHPSTPDIVIRSYLQCLQNCAGASIVRSYRQITS